MVRLREHKSETIGKAIEVMPLPKKVYIPLSQHLGKACLALVKIGDSILTGQKIAAVDAHVSAPIHASISGKVVSIQDWPHPVLGRAKAIVIESDGLDRAYELTNLRTQELIDKFTAEDIRNIVFEAGIVGMGGASFPTYIKLKSPKPIDTLIINGAECEPYLSGDNRLMVEKTTQILKGVELVAKCSGAKDVYIAIEENKPEAIAKFKIENSKFKIKILKSDYPQGGEKQLIRNILGQEVPRGKLPFDVGVLVQNVATCFAIYEAVYLGKPLYERIVTVTGGCVSNPKNLLVRLGTPLAELIDFCGPLKEDPVKIITGGPMMGIAQFTDEVPVIKSTTGVLVFGKEEAKILDEEFCIRCGACVRECPVDLMPCLINLASEKEMWLESKNYGALDCIECGICNYVCPAKRRLVQTIKRAKLELVK